MNYVEELKKQILEQKNQKYSDMFYDVELLESKLEGYETAIKKVREWIIPIFQDIAQNKGYKDKIIKALKDFDEEFGVKK